MKVERLHSWQVSITEALDIQLRLAAKVSKVSEVATPHFIAGVDISVGKTREMAIGAVNSDWWKQK
jgi:deoxyinosine 3'endonuclease (endonuclease V)